MAVYDQQPAQTRIPIRLDPYGSVFVVFHKDDASGHLTAITRDGVEASGILSTTPPDLLGKLDGIAIEADGASGYRLEVSHPGVYEARTAAGKRLANTVPHPP
ncbi:MAG: hypothetical protein NTY38_01030, partial [Acidobacteria bacterium]|nr:hypothetical protein [Acidobacteriota bacterium]